MSKLNDSTTKLTHWKEFFEEEKTIDALMIDFSLQSQARRN